jgi:flagellin FlaB
MVETYSKEEKVIKLMKAMFNLHKGEKGMTGLETAIILIAFVTVAAVFGYAVLSAGLFSAEQGKATIYAGLNEARSNLELSGSVLGESSDNATLGTIKFTVKLAIDGNPIDMTPSDGTSSSVNKTVISLTTKNDYLNNIKWTKAAIGQDNGNDILDPGEQFEITIVTTDLGSSSLSQSLGANDSFSLQVKPSIGASVTIARQLPPAIEPVMDLH